MSDKPKRVILIAGHQSSKTLALMLAQAYGAGTIKQAQISGEYPPRDVLGELATTSDADWGRVSGRFSHTHPEGETPVSQQIPKSTPLRAVDIETTEINGDPTFTYAGGTITGRFSRRDPPFAELKKWAPEPDERTRNVCKGFDFSKIEERVMAHMSEPPKDLGRFNCRGDYVYPEPHPADKWAGIDKRTLSEFDQARRFVDLYSMGPTKLGVPVAVLHAQYFAQLEAASRQMTDWHAKMQAEGFEPEGDGPLADSWVKKRTVIDLPKMLEDAGIDKGQLPGWELRVAKDGYEQDENNPHLWSKEDDDAQNDNT